METKTVKLYSLDYNNVKTYLAASLFILGNLALPQLFHLIPQGGITWLPIYFFTLVGAYKFGWKVGVAFPTTYAWKMANYGKVHAAGVDATLAATVPLTEKIRLIIRVVCSRAINPCY